MATYSIDDLSRREILRMSAVLGIASAASTSLAIAQTAGQRTPEQILGPFYPLKTLGQNADLTKVPGRPGRAAGAGLAARRHGACIRRHRPCSAQGPAEV